MKIENKSSFTAYSTQFANNINYIGRINGAKMKNSDFIKISGQKVTMVNCTVSDNVSDTGVSF